MIASMFNLDHRLAELRPTEQELRMARDLRKAAAPATRPARSDGEAPTRNWSGGAAIGSHLSRLAAV
jgi:hypothetical protein